MTSVGAELLRGVSADLSIWLDGNHVLDTGDPANPISAEFILAELPTGDYRMRPLNPGEDPIMLPGGRFESWFRLGRDRIRINDASREELLSLPRVGDVMAERVVRAREEGPLDEETLRAALRDNRTFEAIRDLIRFD
jgi:hypothetical protein